MRALVAAKYAGVNVEVHAGEAAKNIPLGRLPALETTEGQLFGANTVARHLAKQGTNNFLGANSFQTSEVEQWIEFAQNEIDLPAAVLVLPVLGQVHHHQPAADKALADLKRALEVLNKHFATRTYLVGNRLSLADVTVATSLHQLYQRIFDAATRKPYINTNRWFLTVVNQPEFKAAAGDFTICEKREAPKEPQAAPKKEAAKKEEKPKAEKPKKDDDEEEEESYEDEGPKKKNPLDDLPASKLNLEEWKRVYSNKDTRSEAIPWFWEHYDPAGYSLWQGDYKYNDENKQIFKTANLLGGFIQRLDKVRKYGFASLVIFGEEPNLEVSIVFLVRGTVVPPELSYVDDFEHYNWRQLNPSDQNDKEIVNDFWAWDGNFGGKKFNQGKSFR